MKKGLVPELRFPQFNSEWEKKKLYQVSTIKGGYAFSSRKFTTKKSKYQVIKMGNVYKNELLLDRSPSYIKEISKKEEEYLLENGDIVITLTGTVNRTDFGYLYRVRDEKDLLLNQRLALIKNKSKQDNSFLTNILKHKRFRSQFFKSSVGGTGNQANVSTKNMEQFTLIVPSIQEQSRIGNLFNLIDDKIEKQEEKIINLEEYKNGIIQKLFSQKTRFKDENGKGYHEWKWKTLKEVLVEQNIKCKDNDYEVISSTIKGLYYQKDYFNKEIASNDKSSYKILKKNQIVFSPQNLWMGNINFNDSIEIGIVSPSYKIYDIKKEYYPKFIAYIIKTPYMFHQYLESSEQGASVVRRNLNLDLFNLIKVKVPSLPEQIKIANFLNSIDVKMKKEIEKLDSLKELKKGLMQKMFI